MGGHGKEQERTREWKGMVRRMDLVHFSCADNDPRGAKALMKADQGEMGGAEILLRSFTWRHFFHSVGAGNRRKSLHVCRESIKNRSDEKKNVVLGYPLFPHHDPRHVVEQQSY